MASKNASIAKISRPRMSGVMPRERLFRLLDAQRDRPVVWVSGPAGSGKTTLISSYLDSRKLPSLWYQVDEGDSDPATFFYYMGLAGKKAAPRYKRPLPLMTPEYLLGILAFAKRYFEDLYSRLKHPFSIVLDNYQDAPDGSHFHDVLSAGLSVLPEGITVIIMSRNEPPSSFARLRANEQVGLIGWDNIRLTEEESHEIARLKGRNALSKEALSLLYRKTGGWAAGLVLLIESVRVRKGEYASPDRLTSREIFAYFATEIFQKTDGKIQQFLLETAFLPTVTPQAAEKLTGNPQAGRILSRLHRDNFFTHQHTAAGQLYYYHPLFREFLLSRAAEIFGREHLAGIRCKSAKLLEASGQCECAMELYRDSGERHEEARVILEHAPEMVGQGRWQTVLAWIEALPVRIIDQDPRLLYWRGVCLLPFSPPKARDSFEKSFHLCEQQKELVGTLMAVCGIIDSYFYEWDDFKPLDRWLDRIDELLKGNPTFPSADIEVQVAISVVRAAAYRRPQNTATGQWVERMLTAVQRHPDPNLGIAALLHASTFFFWMGEYARCRSTFAEAKRMSDLKAVSPFGFLLWKVLESSHQWTTLLPGSRDRLVSESLAYAHMWGFHLFDHWFFAMGATDALCRGQIDKADHFLQSIASLGQNNRRISVGHYHFLAAWRHVIAGDLAEASAFIERACHIIAETGILFFEASTRFLFAHVMYAKGDGDAGDKHLAAAEEIRIRTKSHYLEWIHLLSRSWFSLQRGEEKAALAFLRKAMALGRERGFLVHDGWIPQVMTNLCLTAIRHGIEVEYVQMLVRKHNLIPESPPYECENWPWAVTIYTLGRTEIFRDGKPLQFSKKVPKKPVEMLRVLIALGGRNVSETRLNDMLWPDADGDAAHKNFGMTLIRLREMLDLKDAVRLQEGCVTLDRRFFWVDAWAFEDIIEKADSARKEGKTDSAMDFMEKAIELFKGPFLEDEKGPWALSFRERLRGKFLSQIAQWGRHWEDKKMFVKAIECYQKGLEMDDLLEELYRRIIQCYLRLGRRAEAVSVCRRCEKILKSYGISPSSETETICNSLNSEKK